jgi:MFS family permease
MIIPISSVFWRDLGASYLAIGVLSTVTSLTTILTSPLWGQVLDRTQKRRRVFLGGVILLSISTGLVTLVPGYGWLFPLYIIMAAGEAAFSTSSLALMGDWLEYEGGDVDQNSISRRTSGRRMGTYRGLASLGFGLMAFTAGTVVERLSLRAPYILSAAFLAVAALLALSVKEAPIRTSGERDDDTAAETDAEKNKEDQSSGTSLPLAPLLVAALLWSLVTGAVYAVWANYMVEEIGYSPGQMTRLWSLASLTEFPLMIVAGWMSDRLGRLPMLAAGFVAWTLVFVGYLVVPTMPWIVAVQLIRGFAYSAHTATAMVYAAEVRKREERGRVSGMYSTAGSIGSIAGSTLGGAVTEYAGFRSLIGISAGLIFSGALYLGGTAVKHKRTME